MDLEKLDWYGEVAILVVLTVYIFVGSLIRYKQWSFMHESSTGIIFGAFVAFLLQRLFGKDFADLVRFDDKIFFFLVLPLIIFAAGYNLK